MTNILLIPQIAKASFQITNNSDWNDSIFFGAPGAPTQPLVLSGCQLAAASNVVTVSSTQAVLEGMPISAMPGIPAGAFVGSITGLSTFVMVDSDGAAKNATATNANAQVTLQPPPLDLTGIEFVATLRSTTSGENVATIQTSDGTFINGGKTGILSFNILYFIDGVTNPLLTKLFPDDYVLDIVAMADGNTINLFPEGPATVTVFAGVTDPQT